MIQLSTMTSVCPDWKIDRIIDGMQEYGYKGLEPRIGWNHASGIEPEMGAAERDTFRKKIERAGLSVSCVATGARFACADASEMEKHLEETRGAILLAEDLGAPYIRTFGGPRGDAELYPIVQRTAENYRRILDFASEHSVTILMETHDSWCVSAQVRAVIEEVDHPVLRVLWDIMHPQRYLERPDETMRTVGKYTRHLHAHDAVYGEDGVLQVCGLGEGVIDHATPVKLLNEEGFDGFFSVEVIHAPGSDHDARGVMKQYAEVYKAMVE